uniref:Translationally-controlled tumor protein n=1 Tax=Loxodonta africana TaxID=9785 RepID=G3TWM6_LOXAF
HLDLISHDEMFPAIHKIWEIQDQLWLGLEGKMVRRTEGNIDDAVIDGNASVGGPDGEGTFESTVITGVDIVINHHFTTEAYKKYIKDYMKSIKGKLEEQRPEKVKPFVAGAAEQTKHIRANFKTYQFFFIVENMHPDGMVALLGYREGDVNPYIVFFKGGLEMEKG